MEICIVPYSEAYKAQVFSFTDRCFQELGKHFESDGRHSFYNDILQNFTAFWCLLANGTVAGTAALKDLGNGTAELKALYLEQKYQGRGLGTAAMEYVKAYYGNWKRFTLITPADKTGNVRFYTEKCGFSVTSAEMDGNVKVLRFVLER